MRVERDTKFNLGDLVVLDGHLRTPESGEPQVMQVRAFRVEVSEQSQDVIYCVRVLHASSWHSSQLFYPGEKTITGLVMVAEDELTAYVPKPEEGG